MRVLHVVTLVDDSASYGGPLTVAVNQCAELRARGHDARLLAGWRGAGRPPTRLEGVPAHLFRAGPVLPGLRFSGLLAPGMLRWLRAHAPAVDAAHLHLARDLVPLSAARVLRRSGVPYTVQTHGMVLPDPRRSARTLDALLTLRALRGATARFVLTDAEQDAVESLIGEAGSTERLPNGVRPAQDRGDPAPGAPDVLFMARLHPRKRVLDFATAAGTLLAEGSDATFSVVGPDDGDLPPLREFLRRRPWLAGRLRYEGALDHAAAQRRLARATVFVLPSVDEPFPMTLLEALALGTPSVCTTGCGIAADLDRSRAAVVTEPGPDAVAAAVRGLLGDPGRRARLSAAGVRTVQDRFSLTAVGDRLESAYQRLPEPA